MVAIEVQRFLNAQNDIVNERADVASAVAVDMLHPAGMVQQMLIGVIEDALRQAPQTEATERALAAAALLGELHDRELTRAAEIASIITSQLHHCQTREDAIARAGFDASLAEYELNRSIYDGYEDRFLQAMPGHDIDNLDNAHLHTW